MMKTVKQRSHFTGPIILGGIRICRRRYCRLKPNVSVRKGVDINLDEDVTKSLDDMDLVAAIQALLEFSSKTLIMGHKVGGLLQKGIKGW